MDFGDRLKNLRKIHNLTQKKLGEKLGYSESTISLYESGKRQPKKAEDFIKIANFFGVSVDYLLGRTDVRNHEKPKIETKAFHTIDTDGLPDEAIRQVEEYVELIKLKYKQDKK